MFLTILEVITNSLPIENVQKHFYITKHLSLKEELKIELVSSFSAFFVRIEETQSPQRGTDSLY